MKKEQLYEAIGDINEDYIRDAHSSPKKKYKANRPLLKWGSLAACLCLLATAILVIPRLKLVPDLGPQDVEGPYSYTVAYVGWSDSQAIYDSALNKTVLQSEPGKHLPIFKIDTLADLEQFKAKYKSVFAMDQEFDNTRSFEAVLKQAQWDREIFYEKHSMLIIYIPANSNSLRFQIEESTASGNALCFTVGQKDNAEAINGDKAGWILFIGAEKEALQQYTSFDAVLNTAD